MLHPVTLLECSTVWEKLNKSDMNSVRLEAFSVRKHWNAEFGHVVLRSVSKVAIEVDSNLLRKLENNELKPRHHPGVMKSIRVELPRNIHRGLIRAVGDYPVKALLKDALKLNTYINARHPPPENQELQTRLRSIVLEADQRFPVKDVVGLSEVDEEARRQKRQLFIQKLLNQRTYAWKPMVYGAYEAVVYAVGRGAMEYGVLMRIMHEIAARDPDFKPRSFFDFGSGVGTAMWAASSLWKTSIFEYFNVDSSRYMHDLSELVLREGSENKEIFLRDVYFRRFLPGLETKYDLVVSAFSLFEMPSAEHRKEVLLNLWRKCSGYMIVAEEGTRRGSELVNEAREYLLRQREENLEGYVFAPCAHDFRCPRMKSQEDRTPCNFEAAYTPLRIGDVRTDHCTARYSYVILKKGQSEDATRQWPRLVRPTLVRSKHAICRMCTADAKLQEIIFTKSKHGRQSYRCAKASKWGDRLPIAISELLETEQHNRDA